MHVFDRKKLNFHVLISLFSGIALFRKRDRTNRLIDITRIHPFVLKLLFCGVFSWCTTVKGHQGRLPRAMRQPAQIVEHWIHLLPQPCFHSPYLTLPNKFGDTSWCHKWQRSVLSRVLFFQLLFRCRKVSFSLPAPFRTS